MAIEIPLILVVSVLAGAFANVIRGVVQADYFDYRLFAGSLITAGFAALSTVVILDFAGVTGDLGLIILGLLAGFGADFGTSRLNRQNIQNKKK